MKLCDACGIHPGLGLKDSTAELPKYPGINDHPIDLVDYK